MKKTFSKLTALILTLVMLLQMAPLALANETTKTLADVQADAVVNYDFSDIVFDGNTSVDKTEDLSKLLALEDGSLIVQARFDGETANNAMYPIFGIGNDGDTPTTVLSLGVGNRNNAVTGRYELTNGLYSGFTQATFEDGQWHTIVFTKDGPKVEVTVDGVTGTTGTQGYYNDSKWAGFFSRYVSGENDTFLIGDMPGGTPDNTNNMTYTAWRGAINFFTVTATPLTAEEAQAITLESAPIETEITISNNTIDNGAVGTNVGTITAMHGETSVAVELKANTADNAKFALTDGTLTVAEALTAWETYEIVVVAGEKEKSFTISVLGNYDSALIDINDSLVLNGTNAPDYNELVSQVAPLEDLTILAQFMQNDSGLGSLVGISNNGTANGYFSLYTWGSTLGYELRDVPGGDVSSSSVILREEGLNTVAFVANSEDFTIKLYANGSLVQTRQLTEDSYRMISDMNSVNSIYVGKTDRSSGNEYGLNGTILDLEIWGKALPEADVIEYTAQTPAVSFGDQPFTPNDDFNSATFRIPALYTMDNGDILAAVDVRWGHGSDSPGNLETGVRIKDAETGEWGEAQIINEFLDYEHSTGKNSSSASFIDPMLLQSSTGRVFVLVDAMPSGGGYGQALSGNGMVEVDGEWYYSLTTGDYTNASSFGYYFKRNESVTALNAPGYYTIHNVSDSSTYEDYTLDAEFNIYDGDTAMTITQKSDGGTPNGVQVPANIFYQESMFTVFKTTYLWLRHSDDNGQTWSEPTLIGNEYKLPGDRVMIVGPGRGLEIDYNGTSRLIFPIYDEGSGGGERASVLYSDDNGVTWIRDGHTEMASTNSPGKSSEAQLIELPDGSVRIYARSTSGYVGYGDSIDGGETFTPMVNDYGLSYGNNCMISVINYPEMLPDPTDNNELKPVLISSMPKGSGRTNGVIRIGFINENEDPATAGEKYTVDWQYDFMVNNGKFAYSCLSEIPGGVALLYEGNEGPMSYDEYTIEEIMEGSIGISSSVEAFEFSGELKAGEEVTLNLTLTSTIVPALSDVENATVSVKPSNGDAVTFAYSSISDDKTTITFKGILPISETDYTVTATVSESTKITTIDGLVTFLDTDVVNATVIASEIADDVDANVILVADRTVETPVDGTSYFKLDLLDATDIYMVEFVLKSSVGENIQVTGKNGFSLVASQDVAEGTRFTLQYKQGQSFTNDKRVPIATITVDGADAIMELKSITALTWEMGTGEEGIDKNTNLVVLAGTANYATNYDINDDGVVDLHDAGIARFYYKSAFGDENWEDAKKCDVNGDEKVNLQDMIDIIMNYTV